MRTYSIFLSTTSVLNPPIDKANISRVRWNVNWREIFGTRTGECKNDFNFRQFCVGYFNR